MTIETDLRDRMAAAHRKRAEELQQALAEVSADDLVLRRDRIKLGFLSRLVKPNDLFADVIEGGPRALIGPVRHTTIDLRGGGRLSIEVMVFLGKDKSEDWDGLDVDNFSHNIMERLLREDDFSGAGVPPPGDVTLQSFEYDTTQSSGLVILTYDVSVPMTHGA